MQLPMLGHLDPDFHRILDELVELLEELYRRDDGLTIALSASGTSGMEAGLARAAASRATPPIVAACGLLRQPDRRDRRGATARTWSTLRAPYGQAVAQRADPGRAGGAPARPRLVAVVHAETSTGVAHPLQELAEAHARLATRC